MRRKERADLIWVVDGVTVAEENASGARLSGTEVIGMRMVARWAMKGLVVGEVGLTAWSVLTGFPVSAVVHGTSAVLLQRVASGLKN